MVTSVTDIQINDRDQSFKHTVSKKTNSNTKTPVSLFFFDKAEV